MVNYITDVFSWLVSVVTLCLTYIGFCIHPVWGVLFGGTAVISNPLFHKVIRNKKLPLKLLCLVPACVLTAAFLTVQPAPPASDNSVPVSGDGTVAAAGGVISTSDSTASTAGDNLPVTDDTVPIADSMTVASDGAAPTADSMTAVSDGTAPTADTMSAVSAPLSADNTSADTAGGPAAAGSDSGGHTKLSVHFIDVGQGDATLITCGGHSMLIDAGDNTKGTTVQLYLTKQGVDHLDYLILTHSDADHIGGADVIISKFNIDSIFFSDREQDTKAYRELMDAMTARGLRYSTPAAGENYSLGDASFTILGPVKSYNDPNDSSIALMVEHGEKRFLFTGDCEEAAEADLTASGQNLSADVYQAGHHGSRTSSSQKLMDAVAPAYAVISCGEDNSYGHPHAEVLNRFRSMGIKVFRTDEQGSIVATSDGSSVTWSCAPSETWQAGEPKGSAALSQDQNNDAAPESEAAAAPDSGSGRYIGNANNGKLHLSTCSYLPDPKNRVYFDTREAAVAAGYDDPCKRCNP